MQRAALGQVGLGRSLRLLKAENNNNDAHNLHPGPFGLGGFAGAWPGYAAWAEEGGFFEDAKAGLTLRNYYFNRDFRDPGAAKSNVEEWAQGFIFKFSSGYTPG